MAPKLTLWSVSCIATRLVTKSAPQIRPFTDTIRYVFMDLTAYEGVEVEPIGSIGSTILRGIILIKIETIAMLEKLAPHRVTTRQCLQCFRNLVLYRRRTRVWSWVRRTRGVGLVTSTGKQVSYLTRKDSLNHVREQGGIIREVLPLRLP